jgi:hypothetical protein
MNKIIRLFFCITFLEIFICIAYPAYLFSTQSVELGAILVGFIFFSLILYYGIFCIYLNRIAVNGKDPNVIILTLFNLLPILFYTSVFIWG